MKYLSVGVVTPTHPARNGAFIARASRSVWRQTHPVDGHFIVNDNEGRGAAWTRQRALEANVCEWTAFLDSDDWLGDRHIETLVKAQIETGADYVYSWYRLAYGQPGNEQITETDHVFPPGHFLDHWDPTAPRHTTMTVLVRTELAMEVGFVTVEDNGEIAHRQGEDWLFTLGCNEKGRIFHIAEKTWFWNHHGRNSSGIPGRGDA